ncbi:hypothetical protein [Aneurinibacillus sp. REN35]|uniref:hypothetical protein n=1 Tax=Aneurinibacillus sp. REN35 TaxID=3237286 RepID=UPI0035281F98
MADMMKSIIEEVLHKGRKRERVQGNEQPASAAGSTGQSVSLLNLYRPNYQKQKQQSRLGSFAPDSSVRSANNGVRSAAPTAAIREAGDFKEDQMSALQRLAISQVAQRHSGRLDGASAAEAPQLIGKTKEGEYIWFYPAGASRTDERLSMQDQGGMSAGVITRGQGGSGLLFLLDDWRASLPDVTCEVLPEAVLLFAENKAGLRHMLETAYRDLNRRRIQGSKMYQAAQPSSWLKQQLNLSHGPSVVLWEGVSYFNSVALIERCFANNPALALSYEIREDELLLSGEPAFIDSAMQQIKQDMEQLLV